MVQASGLTSLGQSIWARDNYCRHQPGPSMLDERATVASLQARWPNSSIAEVERGHSAATPASIQWTEEPKEAKCKFPWSVRRCVPVRSTVLYPTREHQASVARRCQPPEPFEMRRNCLCLFRQFFRQSRPVRPPPTRVGTGLSPT